MQIRNNYREFLIQAFIKYNNFGFYEQVVSNADDDPDWFKEICEKIDINNIEAFAAAGPLTNDALIKFGINIPDNELNKINKINEIYYKNGFDLRLSVEAHKIFSDKALTPQEAINLFNKLMAVYMHEHQTKLNDIPLIDLNKDGIEYPHPNPLSYIRKITNFESIKKFIIHFHHDLKNDDLNRDHMQSIFDNTLPYEKFSPDTLQLIDIFYELGCTTSIFRMEELLKTRQYEIITHIINKHLDKIILENYPHTLHNEFINEILNCNKDPIGSINFIKVLLNHQSSELKFPFLKFLLKEAVKRLMEIANAGRDLRATKTAMEVEHYINVIELLLSHQNDLRYHGVDLACLLAVRSRFLSDYNRIGDILDKHNINKNSVDKPIKEKVKELSQHDNTMLMELFNHYTTFSDIEKLISQENYLTIDNSEIQDLLQSKTFIAHVMNDKAGLHPLFDNKIDLYIYNANSKEGKCYISIVVNNQHRFYEVDKTKMSHLLRSNTLLVDFLKWEQVRTLVTSSNSYGENSWKNLVLYGNETERFYADTIRQRIKEQFAQILESIKTKHIRIFEVGSGFGQAGIMCADYAVSQDHVVTLCPSDIHTENIDRIPAKDSEPSYDIKKDITRSDNIEFYLAKMNADLMHDEKRREDTTCILISSGCLCFGIIPGSVTDDLQLMQKLNYYGIDYVIADGLENTLVNTTITRHSFDTIFFAPHYAPLYTSPSGDFKDDSAKLTISIKKKDSTLPNVINFNGLNVLDLSCDANPIDKLMRIANGEGNYNDIHVLDLRFIYLENNQLPALKLLIEKLMTNNNLSHVIFSQSLSMVTQEKYFNFNKAGKVRIIHDVLIKKEPDQLIIEDKLENKLAVATASTLPQTPYQLILNKKNKKRAASTLFETSSVTPAASDKKSNPLVTTPPVKPD